MSTSHSRRESETFMFQKFSLSSRDTTFANFAIETPNIELYQDTIRFYLMLDFEIVKEAEHKEPLFELGCGKPIVKESYLELFSNFTNSSITARIVLIDTQPDALSPEITPKPLLTPIPELSITIFLSKIEALHESLQEKGIPHELHENSLENKIRLVTRDPMGNKVYVTPDRQKYSAPFSDLLDTKIKKLEEPRSRNSVASFQKTSISNFDFRSPVKRIGILTSGGDSQGMNAAVRAVVRMAIFRGCEPFLIHEGYNGLIKGKDMISKASWEDVSGFLTTGGTVIGTARCTEFREYEGRQIAALNLIKTGISALVVIGGDGSLTGADNLRAEWPNHIADLLKKDLITKQMATDFSCLMIVGMVGSIDNDLATTDLTIGAVSALTRICEAVDALQCTASSHHRAFVVEVMGRSCGWLALSAAICTGADYVFIPEDPPNSSTWEKKLCTELKNRRDAGKKTSLVIVAEGAVDSELNPIKSEHIKDILTTRLNYDTRVTILGHVQRGGSPSFYDRYLGTVQGAEAIEAILKADASTPSLVIGILENKITAQPLKEAIKLTKQVANEIKNKNFSRALELRSTSFLNQLKSYKEVAAFHHADFGKVPENKRLNIAIIHVGAPAGGINLATRSAVRLCVNRGHTPMLVYNGFPGLMRGEISIADWMQVDGWTVDGGSKLGTNRDQPDLGMGSVAYQMQKHNINGLIIIGGFEAYTALISLYENRKSYPAFCIPMVLIPATVSNNVPGTEISLGSDTAINFITSACDNIKLSASSNRKRVFIIEVQGGRTGYLAVMGGLAGGASCIYIPEEKISLNTLINDINFLKNRYKIEWGQSQGRIALYNETSSKTYSLDVLARIYQGESESLFDARTSILGHLQQGGTPSPLDRIHGSGFAVEAINWIQEKCWESMISESNADQKVDGLRRGYLQKVYTNSKETAAVVGSISSDIKFSCVEHLINHTDFENRKSKNLWWLFTRDLIDILSGNNNQVGIHRSIHYEPSAVYLSKEDLESYYVNLGKISKLTSLE
ncbi:hypothetical protein BB559_002343 [Furculomyces boomerangus]|uniref:ATP-dependent 6-phosphofructokinase n=1 Tax=Furculomyces boomerangus TaxID=61424 RepID=A0A2T9YWA1_9FUNG|nr:hypothetical protein BB559_002343 [Furculomyces boomerangus]